MTPSVQPPADRGKIRVVYKYGTGHPIPPDATYLSTVTQTSIETTTRYAGADLPTWEPCWLVWHYYEVEIDA